MAAAAAGAEVAEAASVTEATGADTTVADVASVAADALGWVLVMYLVEVLGTQAFTEELYIRISTARANWLS